MNAFLLHPALHPGFFGWDEYLLVALGLLALIVIATMGGKPKERPEEEVTDGMEEDDS